jgi:hypothetical protein
VALDSVDIPAERPEPQHIIPYFIIEKQGEGHLQPVEIVPIAKRRVAHNDTTGTPEHLMVAYLLAAESSGCRMKTAGFKKVTFSNEKCAEATSGDFEWFPEFSPGIISPDTQHPMPEKRGKMGCWMGVQVVKHLHEVKQDFSITRKVYGTVDRFGKPRREKDVTVETHNPLVLSFHDGPIACW